MTYVRRPGLVVFAGPRGIGAHDKEPSGSSDSAMTGARRKNDHIAGFDFYVPPAPAAEFDQCPAFGDAQHFMSVRVKVQKS